MPHNTSAAIPRHTTKFQIALVGSCLTLAATPTAAANGNPAVEGTTSDTAFAITLAPRLPDATEASVKLVRPDELAGLAQLLRPEGTAPLAIVRQDVLGEDGRSDPYVDTLLACGIATSVLGPMLGADHALGATGAMWPNLAYMLSDPATGGRLRTRIHHAVTLRSVEVIADWFEPALVEQAL